MVISYVDICIRLVSTLVLTGVIGLERSTHDRASGFRTHILVGLGSALITLTSIYGFPSNHAGSSDPARLSAQIVSGIGFLGAGAILRYGMSVKGLTTAASIWTSAGLGIACGTGFYFAAGITSLLVVFTLRPLERFEASLQIRGDGNRIWIYAERYSLRIESLQKNLEQFPLVLRRMEMAFDDDGNQLIIIYLVKKLPPQKLALLLDELSQLPGVKKVEF
jgi:putative Mg2+ transporter-C (MgtC) family protein